MKVLSYLAIYLIWGSTYFFIASAVETIPPAWILAIRWTIGGLFFLIIALFKNKNHSKITLKNLLSSILIGFLLLVVGNGLVTIAEKTVDSYIAALMVSTVPLTVSLFNRILFKIKISMYQLLGIVIGFIGVTMLLYDGNLTSFEISLPSIMIFIGILSWAFGTSIGAKLEVHENIFLNSSIQMLTAAILSIIIAFSTSSDLVFLFSSFSIESIRSLVFLIIFGSLAIGAFNYLMRNEPSIRLTSYALVNPIIATSLGIFVGKEEIKSLLYIGLPLIIIGLTIMLYGERIKGYFYEKKAN